MRLSRNIVAAIAFAILAAASADADTVTRARYLMGTICEIRTTSPGRAEAAFAEAARIEGMLSTWQSRSELSRLNRGELDVVSPELEALLRETASWSRATGGTFSPLVRPLIDAWRTRGEGAVPSAALIAAALRRLEPSNLTFASSQPSVRLANGAAIEEGAFGKGYALDRMLLAVDGPAIVNFGGQVAVRGSANATIADPAERSHPIVGLILRDGSLSTSSGSEKTFVAGGRTFCHIVDPRTGEALPPRGSVSVVHASAFVADVLSTALYVMGPTDGPAWARAHGITAIFIDSSRVVLSQPVDGLEVLDTHFTIEGNQRK